MSATKWIIVSDNGLILTVNPIGITSFKDETVTGEVLLFDTEESANNWIASQGVGRGVKAVSLQGFFG